MLDKHDVTYDEYRAAVGFMMKYSKAPEFEIPLCMDLWFMATIHDVEMKHRKGSTTNLEGPYFLEDVPVIKNEIASMENDAEDILLEGILKDLDGNPIEGAELFVWHSDSKGYYTGFDSEYPTTCCRGKVITGADGKYSLKTKRPYPYKIPHNGPTGEMLELMGRHPWRPAHIHWRVRHPNFLEHITQTYFAGSDWNDDDCVDGVRDSLIIDLKDRDGVNVMHHDFVLDPK